MTDEIARNAPNAARPPATSGRFPQLRRTLWAFAPAVFRELVRRDRDPQPLPGARVSLPQGREALP